MRVKSFSNWRAKRAFKEFVTGRDRRPLSHIEREVIELAISTMKSGQGEARAQLAVATYGGLAHPGTHVCFMIDLPDDVELIPQMRDIIELAVDTAPTDPLDIQLFVEAGRLSSVDLTTYADDGASSQWPPLDRIHPPRHSE
jgi:hypothetical protein